MYRFAIRSTLTMTLCLLPALAGLTVAQETKPGRQEVPKTGFSKSGAAMTITPDPRAQQRNYDFKETNEKLSYVLFVSSKVKKDVKAPLIVTLHGLGGDGNFLVCDRLIDLAEEHGYIVVGPLGYNVGGWYGSPAVVFGSQPVDPPNLTELSEKDVMNVLEIMRGEFTVDPDRTFLMGHSMGGTGTLFLGQKYAYNWAALAAIAPAAFLMQQNRADILDSIKQSGIPLMIVQGDMDTAVPAAITVSGWKP